MLYLKVGNRHLKKGQKDLISKCIFEKDIGTSSNEAPVELYLSKHFAIPYQLSYGDQKIVIKNLKKNT